MPEDKAPTACGSSRSRTSQPQLRGGRRSDAPVESSCGSQRPTHLRPTDHRSARTGVVAPPGFANRELREQLAALTGQTPATITQGRMTYDLRRLRLTRHDRKNPQNPLLPSHPVRAPRCAVSSPAPTPASTVPRWPKPRPTALHQVLASATSFKNSKTRSTTTSRRLNSSAENLTRSQQVLKFKSSSPFLHGLSTSVPNMRGVLAVCPFKQFVNLLIGCLREVLVPYSDRVEWFRSHGAHNFIDFRSEFVTG